MKTKRPPLIVILLVVAVVFAGAYYFYNTTRPANTELTASGTMEATEIIIAPELSGKVSEVLVNQGDIVNTGDVLFRLDDTLLQAQRELSLTALDTAKAASLTADAGIASAQAQYDLVLTAAQIEEMTFRTNDWTVTQPADFVQPAWYFDHAEQVRAAQTMVETAQIALDAALVKLDEITTKATSADFLDAEQNLLDARAALQVAQNVLDRTNSTGADQLLRDSAQQNYDDAVSDLLNAQRDYDDAITTNGAEDVLTARADLNIAQESYDSAVDQLRILQSGELSPKVVAAEKGLEQAQAAAAQAHSAVQQANASLTVIDTQISKLTVTAPTDGMILTRALEPGEVVMPGSGLLTMAQLSDLTITVYVPEDRYGEISMGQIARVNVDSFPNDSFTATVIYISDKAEFTPRNVQTAEGRKTTVFAIKLMLEDPSGKLKPGMPADVLFE